MFGTILVGVDDSDHARRAARTAGELAAATGDTVHVVYVDVLSMNGQPIVPVDTARQVAESCAAEARAAGVTVTADVVETRRHVGDEIATLAEARGVGLVVMGSRGESDLSSLLLGSFTHRLLHLSTVPVLVVR